MATIDGFSIKNFKGISKLDLELSGRTEKRVVTLIGLNESGKTTILEAISHFPTNDRAVTSMFRIGKGSDADLDLVPIHRRGVLTGNIDVSGTVSLSNNDQKELEAIVKRAGYQWEPGHKIEKVVVTKRYKFEDGDLQDIKYGSFWDGVELRVRKGKSGKYSEYKRPKASEDGDDHTDDLWLEAVNYIESKLPNIVYFPNFLVDVPNRIYLSEIPREPVVHKYYRKIIENILADTDEGYSLRKHVVERIEKSRRAADPSWIPEFLNGREKDKVDAVFAKLSAIVTKEVLGSWGRVFSRPVSANRIDINWSIDPTNEQPYAEIRVSDVNSRYHLRERSLGFRWFFSFLLFTGFGGQQGKPNLFLLDEPAANLHARAQAELLSSFEKLVNAGNFVIYSTHSHHMIKPEWLSGAYIVENDAIDYDKEDDGQYTGTNDTNIRVTSYRNFVGQNSSRISYFQPVLERLQYIEPSLAGKSKQILVEGPTDFYLFRYVMNLLDLHSDVSVIPGGGAGSLDPMIGIALSRGHDFMVMLDDDGAGRKSVTKYRERWSLDGNVATMGDLVPAHLGKKLETLLDANSLLKVSARFGSATKSTVGNYLAEIAATSQADMLSNSTVEDVRLLLNAAMSRL